MPEGLTQTKTPTSKNPAGFKSECRPVSFRNRGRLQIGTMAGFKSEYPAGINRNPHVLHARGLPGNRYDGHSLGTIIEATEMLTGCAIERAYVGKGYRGHNTDRPRRVFISGQKRGVFGVIERELRRRSAIESIIGHMKSDGHLGRCHPKGREGDAINVILTAVAATSAACSPGRGIC